MPLKSLIQTEIKAFQSEKSERLLIEGDDIALSPTAFTTMALVMHELVTNSAKYGALSVETGKFMIGDYGYGHSNAKSFDEFTAEELAELGLSKTPADILQAGHFQTPQTQEWETKMSSMFEEIKAGF